MNITTWNTQGGTGSRKAIEKLLKDGADIILLQEAARRGDLVDKCYTIQDRTGTRSRHGIEYYGMRYIWHPRYQGGTAIICRSSIELIESRVLKENSASTSISSSEPASTPPPIYHIDHPTGKGERGILCTLVRDGSSMVFICNIHAWSPNGNDWDKKKNSLKKRIHEIYDELESEFVKAHIYILVGGDFNAAAERGTGGEIIRGERQGSMDYENSHFISKEEATYILPGTTQFSGGSLDSFYIKSPRPIMVQFGVLNSQKGDHLPCWLEFKPNEHTNTDSKIPEEEDEEDQEAQSFSLMLKGKPIAKWMGKWIVEKSIEHPRHEQITGWNSNISITNTILPTGYSIHGKGPKDNEVQTRPIRHIFISNGSLFFKTGY